MVARTQPLVVAPQMTTVSIAARVRKVTSGVPKNIDGAPFMKVKLSGCAMRGSSSSPSSPTNMSR